MTPDDAPITQLMLTVQFAPAIAPPNPIQLAEIYGPFRAAYPVFEQIGRAGPMPINPNVIELALPLGAPRNSFISLDRQSAVMFQEDRFSYSWSRLTSVDGSSNYPGFAKIAARASENWEQLRTLLFVDSSLPQAVVGEIAYINSFEVVVGKISTRLSSIYNILNPEFTVSMSSFGLSWLEPHLGGGFMQTQISGPVLNAEGSALSQLQTTARFPVEGSWVGLDTGFEKSHGCIYDAFTRLVNSNFRPT